MDMGPRTIPEDVDDGVSSGAQGDSWVHLARGTPPCVATAREQAAKLVGAMMGARDEAIKGSGAFDEAPTLTPAPKPPCRARCTN